MDYPLADRKVVFLSEHCRRVFGQSQFSTLVKKKDIRRTIRDEVISVEGFPEGKLIDILYYLIRKGVFLAEASIQLELPNLYRPGFASTYQQQAMENTSADHQPSNMRSSHVWLETYDYLVISRFLLTFY